MIYKQCITDLNSIYVSAAYPSYPSGGYHGGIDTVHGNHKVYAPFAGKVVTAHHWGGGTTGNDSWGNYIVVQMDNGNYWLAAHFAEQLHYEGELLNQGDFIGIQGETGNVTGIHTHWEQWIGGYGSAYRADPSSVIRLPNSKGTFYVEWDASGSTPEQLPQPTPDNPPDINPNAEYYIKVISSHCERFTTLGDINSGVGFLDEGETYHIREFNGFQPDGFYWVKLYLRDEYVVILAENCYIYEARQHTPGEDIPGIKKGTPVWMMCRLL